MSEVFEKARHAVKVHYNLHRRPTDEEVQAEIDMLKRKGGDAAFDSLLCDLQARLQLIGVL